jgi:ketosteroid isomerase-like protein
MAAEEARKAGLRFDPPIGVTEGPLVTRIGHIVTFARQARLKPVPSRPGRDAGMISTIRSMFDTIDSCSWRRLSDFFSPECVYERPGFPPIAGTDSLYRFYSEEHPIASGTHVLIDHFKTGAGLMVTGEFTGARRDGARVFAEFADLYQFSSGLISYRRTYFYTPLA